MSKHHTLPRLPLFRITALIAICIVVIAAYFSFEGHSFVQKQERVIKQKSWQNEPVKISKLKIKNKGFAIGQKFLEDDDWLKNLTISVKNVSGKDITFLSLTLDFPKSEDSTQVPSAYSIEYGRNPLFPPDVVLPESQKPIPAGETKDLTLSDEEYSKLRAFLSETNYPASIKQIDIILGDIIFDDGTKWSGGAWFRRDSNDPTRWNVVSSWAVRKRNKAEPILGVKLSSRYADLEESAPQWLLKTSFVKPAQDFFGFLFSVTGNMQEQERVVEKVSLRNEPVEVVEIKSKKNPVSVGQRFVAGDDWLNGLTFKLKNKSAKSIVHAEIELDFPEVSSQDAPFILPLQYGQVPGLLDPDLAEAAPIMPDDSVSLVLNDKAYEGLKRVAEKYAASSAITKVRLRISTIIFQDGTAWRNGFMHRRDPKNPRKWVIIDNDIGATKKDPRIPWRARQGILV